MTYLYLYLYWLLALTVYMCIGVLTVWIITKIDGDTATTDSARRAGIFWPFTLVICLLFFPIWAVSKIIEWAVWKFHEKV